MVRNNTIRPEYENIKQDRAIVSLDRQNQEMLAMVEKINSLKERPIKESKSVRGFSSVHDKEQAEYAYSKHLRKVQDRIMEDVYVQ